MSVESGKMFGEALLLLGGAVVAAPLFKRLGLGTVLGYIAAGVAIGPVALLITGGEAILNVAELGVVFLLFIIGLELKPSRLWSLRRDIFGLGLAQVITGGVVLAAFASALADMDYAAAFIAGFGLALSSTAFAMQLLEEQNAVNSRYGRSAFSILLFQDLAIAPLLAVIPLLSGLSHASDRSGLTQFGIALGALILLGVAGRYLLNPLFRIIANTGAKEAMIAAALFVVLGAAWVLQAAGLSMGMGAFLAGVLLAESSYRHELEADIEPFRGILLGLFFIAVGLSLDLGVVRAQWLTILLTVPLVMAVKAGLIYVVTRLFKVEHNDAIRIAFLLPQGGEFAFVLFSTAAAAGIFPASVASLLIAIVTLSMALTPISVAIGKEFLTPQRAEIIDEDYRGAGSDVMMIGFSRFGQIAAQILLSGGTDVTVIDHSANRVRTVERFGFRIYFGDGRRKEVLEAAGIAQAKVVAVCTRGKETTDKIVELIQAEFPHAKLYVRSYDRTHTLDLRARGVDYEIRETLESGLMFGRRTLEALGVAEETAYEIMQDVRRRDEERLEIQATEGIYGGADKVYLRPATPEPLVRPTREGRRLDKGDAARPDPAE